MINRWLLVLLFVLGVSKADAQQWIGFGSFDTLQLEFNYKNTRKVPALDKTLRALAYSQQKPPETIHSSWKIVASYQVNRVEQGQFKSDVLLKALLPEGDRKVYDFDVSEYLFPTLKAFRLRIYKEDSSLVYIKYFKDVNLSVKQVGQIAQFSIWHQRWADGWYMNMDQVQFDYEDASLEFSKWFQLTNDYQSANFLIDELTAQYSSLQQTPQPAFSFLLLSIRQANYLKKLYQMPFYKHLVMAKNDPAMLDKKMIKLSTLYDLNIQKYLNFVKSEDISSLADVELLVDASMQQDQNLLLIKNKYNGMYKDLYDRLLANNYPSDLEYKTIRVFDLLQAGSEFEQAYVQRIYQKNMKQVDSLLAAEQYSDALFQINNAEVYRHLITDDPNPVSFEQYKARAAYGMYSSYIQVVDRALKVKNTSMAIQYLQKATDLQLEYPKQIITNGIAMRKLHNLLQQCYSDYASLLARDRFDEAAGKRNRIREIIYQFDVEGSETMIEELNAFENRALKN